MTMDYIRTAVRIVFPISGTYKPGRDKCNQTTNPMHYPRTSKIPCPYSKWQGLQPPFAPHPVSKYGIKHTTQKYTINHMCVEFKSFCHSTRNDRTRGRCEHYLEHPKNGGMYIVRIP